MDRKPRPVFAGCKTARVITAAAAIMVVVFLAFVASPEVFLKLPDWLESALPSIEVESRTPATAEGGS